MFKLSQVQTEQFIDIKPEFDVQAAVTYNTKSQSYFSKHDKDIKRILNTSDGWNSPEFAKSVYEWQKKNGFSGKWLDGKLGPATLTKMATNDSILKDNYDVYEPARNKHMGEKISSSVLSLKDNVERVRQEMGATDIPLGMLLGWISVESAGKLNDVSHGAGREAGLFQISEAEAMAIGADQNKIMKDQDYAIKTGIELARHHEQNLAPTIMQLFPKSSDMYWRLVFMGFVNGDGAVKALIGKLKASGQPINNWNDVMKWAQYNAPYIAGHSTAKWLPHIERAFNLAAQIDGPKTATSFNVSLRIKKARRNARMLILGIIK